MDTAHLGDQVAGVQAHWRHYRQVLSQACCSGARGDDLVYKVGPWRVARFIAELVIWLVLAVIFVSYIAASPDERVLVGAYLIVVCLLIPGLVAVLASVHTHTVLLHPDGMVDFITWDARVSIPAQELLEIWTDENTESMFDLGGVVFRYRGGTIKAWRLDRMGELAVRLQALNPALQVRHGEGLAQLQPDDVRITPGQCRKCKYPNLANRTRCENCGARLP